MTSYAHFFAHILVLKTLSQSNLANGVQVPAIGKGNVHLKIDLKLQDVLLLPTFPKSLLLVPKLCTYSMYSLPLSS